MQEGHDKRGSPKVRGEKPVGLYLWRKALGENLIKADIVCRPENWLISPHWCL